MKHILPCAILATSSQLLDNGFFDLIKDLIIKHSIDPSNKKKFNSKSLSQLCLSVITSLWSDIIKSLYTIINKNENNSNENLTEKELENQLNSLLTLVSGPAVGNFENASVSSTKFHNSSVINQCTYGRCLNVKDGSSKNRGDLLLTDSPYVFTISTLCECSEGSILSEHICISWAICLSKNENSSPNINILLTTLQNTLSNDLTITLDDNTDISNNNNAKQKENIDMNLNHDGEWSLYTQCLMAVISSISTLYFGNDSTEYEKNENVWLFMQILSKLPTNTHAVNVVVPTLTKLNSNRSFEDTLEQKRIGYSLFLAASAINHSCRPNATIRFAFDSTLSSALLSSFSNKYSNDSNNNLYLQALKTVKLDIVATLQINSNNQILVSYGPMAGQNNLINRQKILKKQYLFNCLCSACKDEQGGLEDTSLQETLKAVEKEKNKQLIISINNIRLKILNLSNTMTELFSGSNRNNNSLMDSFLFQYLKPIKNDLILLHKQHFNVNSNNDNIDYDNIIFKKGSKQNQLFIDICGNLCCIIDMEARILAHQNKYIEAALLISNSIEIMIKSNSHLENDIIIARERVKLSQLYFSSGSHAKAFILSTKAIKDLCPFVSNDDPDLIEANNINQYIRSLNSKKSKNYKNCK
jgi:hypothetical protein